MSTDRSEDALGGTGGRFSEQIHLAPEVQLRVMPVEQVCEVHIGVRYVLTGVQRGFLRRREDVLAYAEVEVRARTVTGDSTDGDRCTRDGIEYERVAFPAEIHSAHIALAWVARQLLPAEPVRASYPAAAERELRQIISDGLMDYLIIDGIMWKRVLSVCGWSIAAGAAPTPRT